MRTLMNAIEKKFPLPLGGLKNQRSFLSVYNLPSAIECSISNETANGKVFLVADGPPISTSVLLREMAMAAGKKLRLFNIPKFFLKISEKLPFIGPRVKRLTGSLAFDISRIPNELGWKPPFSMRQTFQDAFEEMRNQRSK